MLSAGARQRLEGVDVVVGVVETHGRVETQALLEGLRGFAAPRDRLQGPRAPRDGPRRASWRGGRSSPSSTSLRTRMPPEAAIPKRYQDVEELLAAGIDVYTTLNIQHVESLNDVVAQITRIRVRETVPDFDHRPRRRYRAHRPHARRPAPAAQGRQGLRAADGRARDQALLLAGQPHGLARACAAPHGAKRRRAAARPTCRPTPSRARGRQASACSSASTRIRTRAGLVRYAKRLADRLHAPWTALHVETPRSAPALGSGTRSDCGYAAARRAPRRRGRRPCRAADARRRRHRRAIARSQQRHPDRHRQVDALALVRDPPRIGCSRSHAPRRQHQRPRHRRRGARRRRRRASGCAPGRQRTRSTLGAFVVAILGRAVALGVGTLIAAVPRHRERRPRVPHRCARGRGALRSVAFAFARRSPASLCYNFFFLPPLYTFTIAEPTNVAALVFFTIVAVIVSEPRRARAPPGARRAPARARRPKPLSLQPQARRRRHARRCALGDGLSDRLDARCGSCPAAGGRRDRREGRLSAGRHARRGRSRRRQMGLGEQPCRRGAAPTRCRARSACSCRCAPGAAQSASSASTATSRAAADAGAAPPLRRLADQAALAIERVHLVEDVDRRKPAAEADRLRSALLTSISHDLRTPLAVDHRRGHGAAGLFRTRSTSGEGGPRRDDLRTRPSASTASSPISST